MKRMMSILGVIALMMLMSVQVMAQKGNVTVSGTVTDESGEPLIGVAVVEQGTVNGVLTDENGKYTISVAKTATLLFDYMGFAQVDFDESQTQKPDDLMRVVYVEPGKPAYEAEIRNDLYAEQQAVGGLIEPVYLEEDICIVGNEESKLIGLSGNRRLENGTIMAGSFFVVGDNGSEFRSLTDEETQRMLEMFSQPHEISQAEVEADTGFVFISM